MIPILNPADISDSDSNSGCLEIASASRSKPEKADALFEPALPVPTELCGVQEMAGRVYGTCPPPPDYKHLVNANMERTSELSVSGSNDANTKEHRGVRRKRHKHFRRHDPTSNMEDSASKRKQPKTNLTKNQKRKLKKKQREKLPQTSTQSKEFTYEPEEVCGSAEDKPCVDIVVLREFLEGVWDVYSREATSCCRCGEDTQDHELTVFTELVEQLAQGGISDQDVSTIAKLQTLVTFNDSNRVSELILKMKDSTSLSEGQKQLLATLFNYWLTNIAVLVNKSTVIELHPS
ncbi:hypothetical protein LSAT2_004289 [Lamellibrachia satsuma]|nr:hypothetical protein LSAT2_004289 [Lamellibrachia satsuma]